LVPVILTNTVKPPYVDSKQLLNACVVTYFSVKIFQITLILSKLFTFTACSLTSQYRSKNILCKAISLIFLMCLASSNWNY